MSYVAAGTRYDTMSYRFCGRSGQQLPSLSLGLWHNFGDASHLDTQRAIAAHGLDLIISTKAGWDMWPGKAAVRVSTFWRAWSSSRRCLRRTVVVAR